MLFNQCNIKNHNLDELISFGTLAKSMSLMIRKKMCYMTVNADQCKSMQIKQINAN